MRFVYIKLVGKARVNPNQVGYCHSFLGFD